MTHARKFFRKVKSNKQFEENYAITEEDFSDPVDNTVKSKPYLYSSVKI